MPLPEVLDWRKTDDPSALVHKAARALAEGRIVAFPTETAYVLAASVQEAAAVERLGNPEEPRCALALREPAEALEWIENMNMLGRRLTRRCWPGPVEVVWDEGAESGLARRLPESVRRRLCPSGELALRVPAHDAMLQVLYLLSTPLVLVPVAVNGVEAVTIEQALEAVGELPTFVIDDGACRHDRPTTIVRLSGNSWTIVREGIVSQAMVERLASCNVLFVCTGNTCRSPMAEALFKKMLADRLDCAPEDLPRRGFVVQSAGLSAMMGGWAAAEAVDIVREHGADLSEHQSQPVSARLLSQADFIFVMTRGHLRVLTEQFPRLGPRPRLVSPEGEDVADPIGGGPDVYRECARQIRNYLEQLASEVLQP